MVWYRSVAHLPRSVGAAPVPDIDGLRRAALQASWRRDRRVAQRRMAMRWVGWYAVRGLPLVLIAAAIWFWILPHLADSALAPANPPLHQAGAHASASVAPARPAAIAAPPSPALSELQRLEPGLELRLERPFQSAPFDTGAQVANVQSARLPAAGKPASATDSLFPQLKPDNWLHSQEP